MHSFSLSVMASSDNSVLPFESFKMPSEPHPPPSLSSDEESFEVLGKSLIPEEDVSTPTAEVSVDTQPKSIVDEARKLLSHEISLLEQMSLEKKMMNASLHDASAGENKIQFDLLADRQLSNDVSGVGVMKFDTKRFSLNSLTDINSLPKLSFDEIQSDEIQAKISQIIDENVRLKDTLLQNNMSMKSHYEKIVAWQEDVQKVYQANKQKHNEAKEYIEKLTADNSDLRRQLQSQAKVIANLQQIHGDGESVGRENVVQSSDDNLRVFQLDAANKKIRDLEGKLEKLMGENAALVEEKTNLEEDDAFDKSLIQKLTEENFKLTGSLEKCNTDMEQLKRNCFQLTVELEKMKKYAAEKEAYHLKLLCNTQTSPELMNLRAQLANTQEKLMQAEQSRAVAYNQIAILGNQMRELGGQLEAEKAKGRREDEFYALQTQLEVYKCDFEAEKNAKQVVREERNKLAEDLQNLQRRNQQLQEEIEIARENRDYVVYPSGNGATAPPSETALRKCPKCSFGFKTIQALENHVYRCLELDDHLP